MLFYHQLSQLNSSSLRANTCCYSSRFLIYYARNRNSCGFISCAICVVECETNQLNLFHRGGNRSEEIEHLVPGINQSAEPTVNCQLPTKEGKSAHTLREEGREGKSPENKRRAEFELFLKFIIIIRIGRSRSKVKITCLP